MMRTLTFDGADMRGLIDTLLEAVEVTRNEGKPQIIVNGRSVGDLLHVARMLPEDELSAEHQAKVDAVFAKKQHGYRRTAYNIAHRVNQVASMRRTQRAFETVV